MSSPEIHTFNKMRFLLAVQTTYGHSFSNSTLSIIPREVAWYGAANNRVTLVFLCVMMKLNQRLGPEVIDSIYVSSAGVVP